MNFEESGITNTLDLGVWEPCDNKMHSFESVTVAACVILSIDETVISPPSQDPSMYDTGMMGGNGGGGGMGEMIGSNAMDIATKHWR